jgi:4-amino-4-deoxy-L-arabinose transferase-like glycosyltransferase
MDGQENMMESRAPWPAVIMIALVVAGVYWFIDTRSTLWDRDEPRFSRATAEMVESGNYLYPTFNGRLRPDKPILIYWLMSAPLRVLGPTSLACRFFSAVGIAVTCVLTFLIGRRFLGVRAGLWSMVILASTLMVMVIGTAATSDGILLPTMVAVVALFAGGMASAPPRSYAVLMGLAFGLGLLAKGPVALLPIPVVGVTLWLSRRNGIRVGPPLGQLAAGVCAGVLIFLAWAIPANNATGGEFLRLGIGHHVLARSARPLEHHGGSFLLHLPYYLPVIVAGFFPWTLHLPGAVSAVLGRRVGGPHFRELFLAWVVSIVVIMTLVATKLPHYILFTWPALALAVAGTLLAAEQGTLADVDRSWLRGGVWFLGTVAGGAAMGLLAAPFLLHLPGAALSFWASAAILLAMSALAIRQQLRDRPQASAITLLLGMVVLLLPVMLGVMPALERVKISPALASAIRQRTAPDVPVATFRYGEPTLNFYVGRRIEPLASEEAVGQWAGQPGAGVLVIPKDILAGIEQRRGSLGLQEIASKQGLNYSKGSTLEVAAVLRPGDAYGHRQVIPDE